MVWEVMLTIYIILCDKLKYYGLRGSVNNLYNSMW